ncbi:MAG TPA: universal stress protein [Solirubrobacteraceae bacterium]|nr:universal stress protein [Solirubrobacteraceae bacterium]
MILIAYDGSGDAKAAVAQASKLFPGEPAAVLTVWHRFIDTMAITGGRFNMVVDYDEIDRDAERAASERAREGAALASEAGLEAAARTAVAEFTLADTILAEAAAVEASAVVCGSRGYGGLKSLMLGSTSHQVLQHADLPVVVVPSPDVARARSEHRESLR